MKDPTAQFVAAVANRPEQMPLLSLAVAINAASYSRHPRDPEELRNRRLYAKLSGLTSLEPPATGQWKPPGFIHPFEQHYSLPGELDRLVLPAFASAVDARIATIRPRPEPAELAPLLAFTYMGFLLIHPFVDGNGRTARHLLDYIAERSAFSHERLWNAECPKFATQAKHKEAFRQFFTCSALRERPSGDPMVSADSLRADLRRMADCLLAWSAEVSQAGDARRREYQVTMESIIVAERGTCKSN